jgi:hypothetical protein
MLTDFKTKNTKIKMSESNISEKSTTLSKLIFRPINIQPLSTEEVEYGISDDVYATILLPNQQILFLPKEGKEFLIEPKIELKEEINLEAKLYIYNKKNENVAVVGTNNDKFFTVKGKITEVKNGAATLKFHQWGPQIRFSLINIK